MSKRVLLFTLAVLMALGIYTAVANAGVEGSFTFHISMKPQPRLYCTYDIPDVAQEAHALKASFEDFAAKVEDYCKLDTDAIEQAFLELADYVLPDDVDAIQAKVAEIKDMLDPCMTALEDELNKLPDTICEAADTDFITILEDKKTSIEKDFATFETNLGIFQGKNVWSDIAGITYTQTVSISVGTCAGTAYLNKDEFDEAFTTEWGDITATVKGLSDEVEWVDKLLAIINKKLETVGMPAAVDCPVDGPAEVLAFLDQLSELLGQLNEHLANIKADLDWLKAQYKPWLDKQIGIFDSADWDDCGKEVYVWHLVATKGYEDDIQEALGPDGEVYDLNEAIASIIDAKEEMEEEVDDVLALNTEEEVTGYITDLNDIYDGLDEISVKEWDYVCVELPNSEIQKMDFDFEGILDLNITLSGLTIGNHLAMGIAGIEHFIFSLTTTLGALDLTDEFWFAAPYDANGEVWGPMQFVKKRVNASITIGGLTFDGLFLFEDVNFDYPYNPPVLPPMYGFGAVFTIEGTTVSGIGVTSITGICADPQTPNKVKKYSALGRVNVLCGWGALYEEEGGKSPLWFEVEKLYLTGIQVGPLTLDNYTEFRPFQPISNTLTVSFELMGISMEVDLYSEDITSFVFGPVTWTMALDSFLTFIFEDTAGDLTLGPDDSITVISYVPIQGADFSNTIIIVPQVGIVYAQFAVDIPVAIGTLSASVDYVGIPMTMNSWTFGWSTDVAGLGFDFEATFNMDGLDEATIDLTIPFSV